MSIGEAISKYVVGGIFAAIGLAFIGKGYRTIGQVEGTLDTYEELTLNKNGKLTDLANQAGYRLIEK